MKKYGSVDSEKKKKARGVDTTLKTPIPVSDSVIRNTYMVGKYSILWNLPRPNVSLLDSHSYVSIRQRPTGVQCGSKHLHLYLNYFHKTRFKIPTP